MDLISLIVVLIVAGLIVWLVNSYLPIAQPFKIAIVVLIVVVVCVYLLNAVGIGSVRLR